MVIVLLILVLAVLWAIVMGPALLEKRKASPASSIVAFNERLSVLASTQQGATRTAGPVQIHESALPTPQNGYPQGYAGSSPDNGPPSGCTVIDISSSPRIVLAQPGAASTAGSPSVPGVAGVPSNPQPVAQLPALRTVRPEPVVRKPLTAQELAMRQRRRLILQVLAGAAGGTFVIGLLPGMGAILLLSLVFIAALGGYVALLRQIHLGRPVSLAGFGLSRGSVESSGLDLPDADEAYGVTIVDAPEDSDELGEAGEAGEVAGHDDLDEYVEHPVVLHAQAQ